MNDIRQRVDEFLSGVKEYREDYDWALIELQELFEPEQLIKELIVRENKLMELYCDAYIAANKLDYVKDRHIAKTRLMELMK